MHILCKPITGIWTVGEIATVLKSHSFAVSPIEASDKTVLDDGTEIELSGEHDRLLKLNNWVTFTHPTSDNTFIACNIGYLLVPPATDEDDHDDHWKQLDRMYEPEAE